MGNLTRDTACRQTTKTTPKITPSHFGSYNAHMPNNKMHLPNENTSGHMYIQGVTQEQTSPVTPSPNPNLSNNKIHIHTHIIYGLSHQN